MAFTLVVNKWKSVLCVGNSSVVKIYIIRPKPGISLDWLTFFSRDYLIWLYISYHIYIYVYYILQFMQLFFRVFTSEVSSISSMSKLLCSLTQQYRISEKWHVIFLYMYCDHYILSNFLRRTIILVIISTVMIEVVVAVVEVWSELW